MLIRQSSLSLVRFVCIGTLTSVGVLVHQDISSAQTCNSFGCSPPGAAACNPFGCPTGPGAGECTPFGCPAAPGGGSSSNNSNSGGSATFGGSTPTRQQLEHEKIIQEVEENTRDIILDGL